jgi:ubiquitin C-terminal hydrolase
MSNQLPEYDIVLHQGLNKGKNAYHRKGLCGLLNLGNTCFFNSTLQCLVHSLKLTDYLLSREHTEHDRAHGIKRTGNMAFIQSYVLLLDDIWESNKLIKPAGFFNQLAGLIPKYKALRQQDSHECLTYILDFLHKSTCYEVEVDIQGEVKTERDRLMKMSLESWRTHYASQYSVIKEIFDGMYYNKISCRHCDAKEHVFEPFNTLGVDITHDTLLGCIGNTFGKGETIDTWRCEKCKRAGCVKETKAWTMPHYLIVQLKRFNKSGQKIQNHVSFSPEDINLKDMISPEKGDPNNYVYSLYAVNYHMGSLNSGHYWSSCKNIDGSWYILNDGNVTKVANPEDIVTQDAYMLFYYRKCITR